MDNTVAVDNHKKSVQNETDVVYNSLYKSVDFSRNTNIGTHNQQEYSYAETAGVQPKFTIEQNDNSDVDPSVLYTQVCK